MQAPGVELWTIPESSIARDAEPVFGSAVGVTTVSGTAAKPAVALLVAKACEQRADATAKPSTVAGIVRVANEWREHGAVRPR